MYVPGIGARVFRIPLAGGAPEAAADAGAGAGSADTAALNQASQAEVYRMVVQPMVKKFVMGISGTLFCYGQTGSGKTHAMFGPPEVSDGMLLALPGGSAGGLAPGIPGTVGMLPRACADVLALLARDKDDDVDTSLGCCFVEIYNDSVYDLLDHSRPVGIVQSGAKKLKNGRITPLKFRLGCAPTRVHNMDSIMGHVHEGMRRRTAAATDMNDRSSRSHAVFVLELEQRRLSDDTLLTSTFHMVDLAGSERQKKSGATGERFDEMVQINSSLTALGRVIASLSTGEAHIPYADSTLTRLLSPALGGNCLTSMVVTASCDAAHADETLSTLRFGERTASITNVVDIERQSIKAVVDSLHKRLRETELAMAQLVRNGYTGADVYRQASLRRLTIIAQLKQLDADGSHPGGR